MSCWRSGTALQATRARAGLSPPGAILSGAMDQLFDTGEPPPGRAVPPSRARSRRACAPAATCSPRWWRSWPGRGSPRSSSKTCTGPTTPRSTCWATSRGGSPTCPRCWCSPTATRQPPPATRCTGCWARWWAAGWCGCRCARSARALWSGWRPGRTGTRNGCTPSPAATRSTSPRRWPSRARGCRSRCPTPCSRGWRGSRTTPAPRSSSCRWCPRSSGSTWRTPCSATGWTRWPRPRSVAS